MSQGCAGTKEMDPICRLQHTKYKLKNGFNADQENTNQTDDTNKLGRLTDGTHSDI